jgi:FixJ family two-component response regulator
LNPVRSATSEITIKIRRSHAMKEMNAKSLANLVRWLRASGFIRQRRVVNKRAYDFASVADCLLSLLARHPVRDCDRQSNDDESVRAAMSSLVRSLGYESCAFCSAEEFLTSPRLHDASCLITDVQMQGMSGLELQGELAVRRPDMPVILITAFAEERIRKRAEAAGAVAFFSKPVDSHALIECLDATLRSS